MKILLAEDDRFLAQALNAALEDNGYCVEVVGNGADAEVAARSGKYSLLILDLGLPKLDGLSVLRQLRASGSALPVLIVSARDRLEDRVMGLDAGANDYLTKPFQLPELEARVRALLRKALWDNKTEIRCGTLVYNTATREATVNGALLELSPRELSILELIMQRAGKMVSKQLIADRLSNWDSDVSFNAVDIAMHRLRKKIDCCNVNIRTLRGLGYLLEECN